MKIFLILLSATALANASTFTRMGRLQRDVSHLNLDYLPPATDYLPPPPPPPPTPSNEYLPPVIHEKQAEPINLPVEPSNDYLPPIKEITTEALPATKEYLPPLVDAKAAEEISEISQPSNEYLPPANLEVKDLSGIPLEHLAENTEEAELNTLTAETADSAEILETHTETVQDTAVLKADGYHYKTPSEAPQLLPVAEYTMLPLEEEVVEVEGPSNGETATLEKDGYHYRAIKRRF